MANVLYCTIQNMENPLSTNPTAQAYAELQLAYDHFNAELFGAQLPSCLITLQREKRTCGYFSQNRFANLQGVMTDEIALNPAFFAVVPLTETMQTLVHEMTHLWQAHFGQPGRGRYHNAQWSDKMEAIGLMPSATGQPGGQRTGDHMADYAVDGGRFLRACEQLLTANFRVSWYDRFPDVSQVITGQNCMATKLNANVGGGSPPSDSEIVKQSLVVSDPGIKASSNKSNRHKYQCDCSSVWGKPGLQIRCLNCGETLVFEAAGAE